MGITTQAIRSVLQLPAGPRQRGMSHERLAGPYPRLTGFLHLLAGDRPPASLHFIENGASALPATLFAAKSAGFRCTGIDPWGYAMQAAPRTLHRVGLDPVDIAWKEPEELNQKPERGDIVVWNHVPRPIIDDNEQFARVLWSNAILTGQQFDLWNYFSRQVVAGGYLVFASDITPEHDPFRRDHITTTPGWTLLFQETLFEFLFPTNHSETYQHLEIWHRHSEGEEL
jgi:hypothetical protein